MTNHGNKESDGLPEDPQKRKEKIAEHEELLKEVGITGPGSVDKLFEALPELPTEPLPPLRKPEIPSLPDIPTEPLPPLHEQR